MVYILPVFTILKNMQYENYLRKNVFYREKKNKIWFSKSLFPKGTSGKGGGGGGGVAHKMQQN